MTMCRRLVLLVAALIVSACGSNEPKEVDCDANLKYQNRIEGKRVVAPDGLDQLNQYAEMPIPRADPSAPKMPEGVCNDRPPVIKAGS
jgi:uncharacterized lipoprotein